SDKQIARFIEDRRPEFRDRLSTAIECDTPADPVQGAIYDLLLEDTARYAEKIPSQSYLDRARVQRFAMIGAVSLAVLLGLSFFGPSMFRYGAKYLWTGWLEVHAEPLYRIDVTPGDTRLARRSNQLITARPQGFQPRELRLMAWHESGTRWEESAMKPAAASGG